MSYRVVFTPEATAALLRINDYISERSGDALAAGFVDKLIAYCEGLSLFPRRGEQRDDLRPGLRTIGFRGKATIAFTVAGDTVTIIQVLYGGRDLVEVLKR